MGLKDEFILMQRNSLQYVRTSNLDWHQSKLTLSISSLHKLKYLYTGKDTNFDPLHNYSRPTVDYDT